MDQAKPTVVFRVRDRPVGYVPGRWGGAFVAMERGYFPISPAGFWSWTGFVGRPEIAAGEKQRVLDQLAGEQDRARAALLKDLREAHQPVGDPIANYIHASMAYERAVAGGFFATDQQRVELWAGAHRLLCLVTENPGFQPAVQPTYPAWNAGQCAKALDYALTLRRLLGRWARGDLSEGPPIRMLGAHAYFDLPEKPGGEPTIALGGYTAEMALGLSEVTPTRRVSREREPKPVDLVGGKTRQMNLFEGVADDGLPTTPKASLRI